MEFFFINEVSLKTNKPNLQVNQFHQRQLLLSSSIIVNTQNYRKVSLGSQNSNRPIIRKLMLTSSQQE
ncbi:hypothetical protein pb186bvf_000765 [Paramecium bursaria]